MDHVHCVYDDTQSVFCFDPKIREQRPSEIRNKKSLETFNREIKKRTKVDHFKQLNIVTDSSFLGALQGS